MSELIFETLYVGLFYEQDRKEIEYIYYPATIDMKDEVYIAEVLATTSQMEQRAVENVLIDFRELATPISPEIQETVLGEVLPRWQKIGIQKVAVILPTEFVTSVSVDQMVDDTKKIVPYSLAYFDNKDSARQWFL